jgi:ribonuclease III
MRSKIVSREHLNELGKDLNLVQFIESKVSVQHFGENIHGNIFESLIGAIYLDRGYVYCEKFIQKRVIEPYVDIARLEGKVISYKSLIIEWCQKEKKSISIMTFLKTTALDGQRFFGVKLSIDDIKLWPKLELPLKRKQKKRHPNVLILHFKKK